MPTTSPNRYLPQLPHTADRIRPWILLFLIWLSGWGISTIYSLFTLGSAENSDNPWSSGLDALLNTTLLTGTSLACLIIALRTYKIRPAALGLTIPLRPTSLYWLPAAFLMALGAVLILNLTQDLITTLTPVTPQNSPNTIPDHEAKYTLLSVIISGPAEELCLITALITLPRIALPHHPHTATLIGILLALAARVGLHIYYGPGLAPAYGVWALLLIGVWWITPSVWGQFAAHLAYNVFSVATRTSLDTSLWETIYHVLAGVGIALIIIHVMLLVATRGRRGRALRSAA